MKDKQTCQHKHGALIPQTGFWLCGQCYAKLEERPARYTMAPTVPHGDASYPGPLRQEVWKAEIRKSAEGLTLADFVRTMAKRFQRRSAEPISDHDAAGFAIDTLETFEEEFGDPALAWDHAAARELADEEMEHWEPADDGANA